MAGLTGLKETSVGNLFAGAIFPGLVLSGLYFGYILVRCTINPSLGPPISREEASSWSVGQKIVLTLKSLIPPILLILAVMGSILAGIATPTEAAGLGAFGALILAIINRKFSWEVMRESARSTLSTTAMVMMLFIGGKFFSSVFLFMGGGDVVADVLVGSGMNRWVVLLIMMGIVFLMGMFIDWAAILLVTVPIFMPIAMELDFDPLWFSILLCVNLQTSFLTPPFGYALFYFKGVAPEGYTMGAHLSGHHPLCAAADCWVAYSGRFPRPHYLVAGNLLRAVEGYLKKLELLRGLGCFKPIIP